MKAGLGLWPVDKLILGYFGFALILIFIGWHALPQAPLLLFLNLAAAALLLFEIGFPNPTSWLFRNWYPVVYVAACYREMDILVPALRHRNYDQWLAGLDYRLWHANPTVWLERIQSPAFTEYL
ncbi:MAG TPA: hypothetical protein VH640_05580, partial [Bryobacteraceae bacterium]